MARMCCSNCEVTAPSIVQWPLLWTRGAISLTTGPSALAKNSTVRTPTWPSASAIASAAPRALGDLRRATVAARHGRAAKDAVLMLVLRRVPEGVAAVFPAGEDHGEFGEEATPASATAGSSPIADQAAAASSAERIQAWPLPSYP